MEHSTSSRISLIWTPTGRTLTTKDFYTARSTFGEPSGDRLDPCDFDGQPALRAGFSFSELELNLYSAFARFLLPLVLAMAAQELSLQFINGGMARIPYATETLAAFGLAFGLTTILTYALSQARQLGLVLVENRPQLRRVTLCVSVSGLSLSMLMGFLGGSDVGTWVIQDFHRVDPDLAREVKLALWVMSPVPLLNGWVRYYSGLLARVRRTEVVSASSLLGIAVRIGIIFAMIDAAFVQARPIFLPVAATLGGVMVELLVLLFGHFVWVRPNLAEEGESIDYTSILRFFWPLVVIMAMQGLTRPLINLYVSRGSDATEALAVLTVVYALGHVHYGWLNELRSLAPAFQNEKGYDRVVRRFIVACGALGLIMAFTLFWIPAIRTWILEDLIGISASLAVLCIVPLYIITFFPLAVSLRTYYHGRGLVLRKTEALAPSGPARLFAAWVALTVTGMMAIEGATRGITALFCGFCAEALTVRWGVRRH